MAQESCNLDKEEAEILKPASSSSPSSPPVARKDEAAEILKVPLSSPSSPSIPSFANPLHQFSAKRPEKRERSTEEERVEEREPKPSVRLGNRCSSCRKKVGLTGFRCRCGDLFCGQHRYSDTHDCSFDYKAFGREQISKANPVIRAAKIIKI